MKKRNSFAILTIAGAAVLAMASCTPAEPDKPDPKPEHTHTYSELHAKVEPTCLSEGVAAYYSCTGCDLLFNENKEVISQPEAIPALAHTPHHHDAVAPGCETPGSGEYWTCDNEGDDKLYGDKDCKEVIQAIPSVDPKGHKLSHMDGNPASCTEAGWKEYYKCDDCDALFEDAQGKTSIADLEAWKNGAGKLDLAPHSAQKVDGQASTCKEYGWKDYYHCGGCDGYFEDAEATKPIVNLAAWKEGAGRLELAAHTPVKQDGHEPTCTSDGWADYYKCSVCDRLFEDEACETEITDLAAWKLNAGKLPMGEHGHKLVAGEASTCKEHGYKDAYLCEGCGKYFEDAEAKTLIGDADAYEAWKVAGGQLPFAAHTPAKQDGQASSCTEHGWADYYQCSVCDRMFEEEACETEITDLDVWKVGDGQLPLKAHETSKVGGQAATCEADGWKDYYQCSECEGFFEDEAAETPIADLAAWKVGDGKIPAKGHDEKLTYIDPVAESCTEPGVIGYYKCESCGKFFEDASANNEITDLAAWKENGGKIAPHAHTLGDLIPQVNRHRDQDGMKPHYVCAECNGYFDEEENACTADDLKIANTYGTFKANEDAQYVFKSPLAGGSKVVFDFKFDEADDAWINFCLMDNTWANHTEYITVYANGNCKNIAGVTVAQILEDGYIRVTVDTSVVPCEGTLEQIDFMYIRGATSNGNGSYEYDPIGGSEAPGEKFSPGKYQYKLRDEVDLAGTVSTFDVSFITEGYVNFRFEELNWGNASKYIKLSSEGLLGDFREGVTVKEIANIPDGILARYRVTVDFNQIDKWSETPLTSIGRLTIHPDITATGTIDVNNPNEYEYKDSIVVTPGNEYFFDKAYDVEEYLGLSLEYRMSDETAVSRVMLEDVESYIGDLGFKSTGLDQSYAGVTAETLSDGFIKVTVIFGNVTRCGASWSTSVAAKNIKAIHSIKVHASWGTPGAVEIRNVQGINEISLPNRGDKFSFAYPLDLSICRKLSFDYKLEADSDDLKTKVMFNANTGYVGDYGFKRNGPEQAYQGVTYESLDDGFIHVTIEFSKVNRANASWFSSLGWSSLSDGGINTITSIQTHSSWGDGCPITFRNVSVEKSARDARTFTAADYVDLPVKYTADELFGKALTFEYKLESGGTHSDYAHIVMMNTGWKNISGEIDLFGDATCNKGTIEAIGDDWYKATIDIKQFNGDGNVRDGITNFRLEKFGGDASSLTIDWETLRVVDFDREYEYDAGGIIFKGITPIENWKTSGKKIVIECEKGSKDKGGQKFVFGLRDSNNESVAEFTIRLDDHVAKKGNNGGDIFTGVPVDGNIYRYEIDLSLLDTMGSFTGAESVVSINADEAWMNMIVHSVVLCDK